MKERKYEECKKRAEQNARLQSVQARSEVMMQQLQESRRLQQQQEAGRSDVTAEAQKEQELDSWRTNMEKTWKKSMEDQAAQNSALMKAVLAQSEIRSPVPEVEETRTQQDALMVDTAAWVSRLEGGPLTGTSTGPPAYRTNPPTEVEMQTDLAHGNRASPPAKVSAIPPGPPVHRSEPAGPTAEQIHREERLEGFY